MARTFRDRNSSAGARRKITRIAEAAGLDVRAVHILISTFDDLDDEYARDCKTPAEEFEYAKSMGVMRDPVQLDHDGIIARLIAARDRLDRHRVANAFIRSLTTRRKDIRSALGSYAAFLHLEPHPFVKAGRFCRICGLCGNGKPQTIEDNVYVWVRLVRAGSVHHTLPDYAGLDLSLFESASFPESLTAEDRTLFTQVLNTLRKLPADTELSGLQKSLTGIFPSDKYERQLVCEILGYCGVLQPKARPSLREQFVEADWRADDEPSNYWKKEWHWPVQHWTGADGVNEDAVKFWFPGF